MNRLKLIEKLKHIDGWEPGGNLPSSHIANSIETGNTSYTMSSLFEYLNHFDAYIAVLDVNFDEIYEIHENEDIAPLILHLCDVYKRDPKMMAKEAGIMCTLSEDETLKININTLLAMIDYFHCEIDFLNNKIYG